MKNWQYIGTILTGIAALITAGIGVYDKLYVVHKEINKDDSIITKEYGIVNDKDGWVNLREAPDLFSSIVVRILNDTNLEIIGKVDKWFNVRTESGRTGYVFYDRLIIVKYNTKKQ